MFIIVIVYHIDWWIACNEGVHFGTYRVVQKAVTRF